MIRFVKSFFCKHPKLKLLRYRRGTDDHGDHWVYEHECLDCGALVRKREGYSRGGRLV